LNILSKSNGPLAIFHRVRSSWATLSRAKRGGTGIFVAAALPALIVLGGLSVDKTYVDGRAAMLRRTTQSAALTADAYLNMGQSSATVASKAQSIAASNMPVAQYGTVLPAGNIVLGTWSSNTFTATTTNPNAVQVTALNTAANGNAVNTFFGGLFGKPSIDISSSAVAGYGTGKAFNTIILNDLSMSFSSEVAQQRAADLAILSCIAGATSTTSQIGIIGFTGHASTLVALGNAVTNSTALTTYVNHTLNYCGNSHMPACSGSNVAAGLYTAITQLRAAGIANSTSNIIVITDGVPNADSLTYGRADGIYATPTSLLPVCTVLCSDANLWTMAQNQAAYAGTLGINISTVYYTGDTTGSTTIATYAAQLRSLVTGTGVALTTPTATQIAANSQLFCGSMGSQVKLVR
jgi:Flp pilus assembly protein TadG